MQCCVLRVNMLCYCVIVCINCVNYIHGRIMYIGKDEH